MKNSKKILHIRQIAIIGIVGVLAAAGLASGTRLYTLASTAPAQASSADADVVGPKTPEEALQRFVASMARGDRSGLSERFVRNIEQIEKAFGPELWTDVDFTEIEGPPIETREAYVMASTGEEISYQDYERILDEYVIEVCSRHSLNKELLYVQGEALDQMTADQMTARIAVNSEISATCPVRMVGLSASPFRHYQLKFSGRTASDAAGICNVEVDFVLSGGVWVFHSILYSAVDVYEDDV